MHFIQDSAIKYLPRKQLQTLNKNRNGKKKLKKNIEMMFHLI